MGWIRQVCKKSISCDNTQPEGLTACKGFKITFAFTNMHLNLTVTTIVKKRGTHGHSELLKITIFSLIFLTSQITLNRHIIKNTFKTVICFLLIYFVSLNVHIIFFNSFSYFFSVIFIITCLTPRFFLHLFIS